MSGLFVEPPPNLECRADVGDMAALRALAFHHLERADSLSHAAAAYSCFFKLAFLGDDTAKQHVFDLHGQLPPAVEEETYDDLVSWVLRKCEALEAGDVQHCSAELLLVLLPHLDMH